MIKLLITLDGDCFEIDSNLDIELPWAEFVNQLTPTLVQLKPSWSTIEIDPLINLKEPVYENIKPIIDDSDTDSL